MKRDLREIVMIVALFVALLVSGNQLVKKNRIIREKSDSITNLLTENKLYKRKSGKQALIIKKATVTVSELENSNDTLLNVIDDLKLRLRNVVSISQTVVETNNEFEMPLRDSVVLVYDTIRHDYVQDTMKSFQFSDEFIEIQGIINLRTDSISQSYHSWDKLTTVLGREKRERWWKIWKRRQLVQTITNENPHNTIVYSRYVEISH